MQISDSLEVGIGLSFIFFLSSLVLASIHEMIETVIKARGKFLFDGVIELFNDPKASAVGVETLVKTLYQHPLIRGLMHGDVSQPDFRNRLPSYLPTRSFVLALVDQVAQGKFADASSQGVAPAAGAPIQQLRMMAEGIPNDQVRTAVTHAIDASAGDLDALQANLEHWFDSAMDRVSGWYKRRSQRIIFALGLLTALSLNVNTIVLAEALANSTTLRHAVESAASAEETKCAAATSCGAGLTATGAVAELDRTSLPVGWTDSAVATMAAMAKNTWDPVRVFGLREIAVGYLLTAFAVTLGAPFWFDVLNRLMVIRATVKPTEKSPDEASQDPQPAGGGSVINNIMPTAPPAVSPPPPPATQSDGAIYLTPPEPTERLFEDDDGQPVAGASPAAPVAPAAPAAPAAIQNSGQDGAATETGR
jgi:hypothetical protein